LSEADRSLAQARSPQMPPGPHSPDYCAGDNDYNPYAGDLQHIRVHQYVKKHFSVEKMI